MVVRINVLKDKFLGGGGGVIPSASLERTRIEKAAIDAGFDVTPEVSDDWLLFRSSAFPVQIGVLARTEGYDFGVSDASVGLRLSGDLGVQMSLHPKPWEVRLNGITNYAELHHALQRGARIAQAVSGNLLNEFLVKAKQIPDTTEVQRLVSQRVGQDIFRRELIGYWGGKCAVTGLDVVDLLRASHIKAWAKCDSDNERLDVFNGLLLAPHLDVLFDGGWVTFADSGHICISSDLNTQQRTLVGLSGQEYVKGLTERHLGYLEWHRDKLFRKT